MKSIAPWERSYRPASATSLGRAAPFGAVNPRKATGLRVEDAYGLTPEERQLLRDTRPVRDPIDVLEARISGLSPEENRPDEESTD